MAILLLLPSLSAGRDLAGRPRVLDGDTLVLEGTKVRLRDIDAPERDQWCLSPTSAWYPCGEHTASYSETLGILRCAGGVKDYGCIYIFWSGLVIVVITRRD